MASNETCTADKNVAEKELTKKKKLGAWTLYLKEIAVIDQDGDVLLEKALNVANK